MGSIEHTPRHHPLDLRADPDVHLVRRGELADLHRRGLRQTKAVWSSRPTPAACVRSNDTELNLRTCRTLVTYFQDDRAVDNGSGGSAALVYRYGLRRREVAVRDQHPAARLDAEGDHSYRDSWHYINY